MKTRDGHEIKRGSTYYLVLTRKTEFNRTISYYKITKCKCRRIRREYNRVKVVDFWCSRYFKQTCIYIEDTRSRLFKDLTKAKQHCIKMLDKQLEDFETAYNQQINGIKRTRK